MISLSAFDEDARDVDPRSLTPRSADVCAQLGIEPNELLRRPLGFFAALPMFHGMSHYALELAATKYEASRRST